MNVAVVGLGHLGTVTAACLASAGHHVVGFDFDLETARSLQLGQPAFFEPGLEAMLGRELSDGRLHFVTEMREAIDDADIVWVAYDTPLDVDARADVEFVVTRVVRLYSNVRRGALMLISSQLPAGTTRRLEKEFALGHPDKLVTFAYVPENLQLGKAISGFNRPERIVVGLRSEADRDRVTALLRPFSGNIEWMSVESAEMTKHALNAFLGTCVAFVNEIAVLCEHVGADPSEVERGLRSDARIGRTAYLSPGAAFSGGTLAREINFLTQIGVNSQQATLLLTGVRASNEAHKQWVHRKLSALLGQLRGQTVAVWGLAYKSGTNSVRHSNSIELCEWLVQEGARVQAHDPVIKSLPPELSSTIILCATPAEALVDATALVIATPWTDYLSLSAQTVASQMRSAVVVDPGRFLINTLGRNPQIRYASVGSPL